MSRGPITAILTPALAVALAAVPAAAQGPPTQLSDAVQTTLEILAEGVAAAADDEEVTDHEMTAAILGAVQTWQAASGGVDFNNKVHEALAQVDVNPLIQQILDDVHVSLGEKPAQDGVEQAVQAGLATAFATFSSDTLRHDLNPLVWEIAQSIDFDAVVAEITDDIERDLRSEIEAPQTPPAEP